MSQAGAGPTLVVAFDDVAPGSVMAADLEELMSLGPGPRLKVLVTTDRADALTRAPNGRTPSTLGVQAATIALGPMRLEAFEAAARALAEEKILFSQGAQFAQDYRAPWVPRATSARPSRSYHGSRSCSFRACFRVPPVSAIICNIVLIRHSMTQARLEPVPWSVPADVTMLTCSTYSVTNASTSATASGHSFSRAAPFSQYGRGGAASVVRVAGR